MDKTSLEKLTAELQETARYLADKKNVFFRFDEVTINQFRVLKRRPDIKGFCSLSRRGIEIVLWLGLSYQEILSFFLHETAHAKYKFIALYDREDVARKQAGYWRTVIGIRSEKDLPADEAQLFDFLKRLRRPDVKEAVLPMIANKGVYHLMDGKH